MVQKTTYNSVGRITYGIIALVFFVSACSSMSPAAFWLDFHKELIAAHNSDQGPWGGHKEVSWVSENGNRFSARELIDFAAKNDWVFEDSISLSIDTINRLPGFTYKSDDYSLEIFKEHVLPKMKSEKNTAFIFKTKWLAVEPGNTRETFINGFALLNSDRTILTIYHLWGE